MRKIDPKEINQVIDGIKGVCAEGKLGVKKLVEKLFDVQLVATPVEITVGSVWKSNSLSTVVLIACEDDNCLEHENPCGPAKNINMIRLDAWFPGHLYRGGSSYTPTSRREHLLANFTKIADTPADYIETLRWQIISRFYDEE